MANEMTIEAIEQMAEWSDPKEVQTKNGPRILRKAEVSERFRAAWKINRDAIKALGAGWGKTRDGEWELTWWQELDPETKQARAASIEASKAAGAAADLRWPAGLTPYPYQVAGVLYALARKHVLIADEMGLGKTIQAIGIVNNNPAITSVLVVCPKSLKINWLREFTKWQTRDFTIGVINAKGNGSNWVTTDVVIINYEQLPKYKAQINARTWGALILDEAHMIKSNKTQRSHMIKGKGHTEVEFKKSTWVWDIEPIKADHHLRLTGTPIVNRPIELHNLIGDIEPIFENFWQFARRYAGAHHNGFGMDFGGAQNLDELQRRLRETIMVRRLKVDVLKELPAKIRQIVPIEADTADLRHVLAAENAAEHHNDESLAELRARVELAKAESEEAYKAAVRELTGASQAAFEELARLRHETAVAKVPVVVAHVRAALEDNDEKIIIAAHHHDVIDLLMSELAEFKPVKLTGRDSIDKRQRAVDAFQAEGSPHRVFVASIQAAGVGITLTAASTVVFAELDWVPGNLSQMEDRAHRIGQQSTVLVQHIVLDGSIDARMAQVLIEKQRVIDSALDANHPERTAPVYVPRESAASHGTTPDALTTLGNKLTADQVAAIHSALRLLAGDDQDRAAELNGVGFNRVDGMIGHSLAGAKSLSPKQAAIGYKVVCKYHKQIGDDLMAAIKGSGE